jgi:hypothetical protein
MRMDANLGLRKALWDGEDRKYQFSLATNNFHIAYDLLNIFNTKF